jgi:outer membrane protein assembly factor BamB
MAARSNMIVVAIKGTVLAIDRDTGETLWSTALKGSDFVNLSLEGADVFAGSKGRLYRLDATSGEIRWCNELPGLGWGIVSIAGGSQGAAVEEKRRRDAQAAAAVSA